MADLIKNLTVIGVTEEVTEGTYVAPSASTDFFQPLSDGFESSLAREQLERNILTSSNARAIPLKGMKDANASYPVEFRASGTEGEATDFDLLLQSQFGAKRTLGSRFTTGTTHTTSVLNGTSVDSSFAVGDPVLILESGDHSLHVVTAVTSTTLTYSPVRSSAPSDNVEVAKFTSYSAADSGHPSLSITEYLRSGSDIIEKRNLGMRCQTMAVENFSTGQLANLAFSLVGLDHQEVAGASLPATPSYDSGLPSTVLNACLYQDGVVLDFNEFSLSYENELLPRTNACDANGKDGLRYGVRNITGSFNPYKSDSSITTFTNFNSTTAYSLVLRWYTPSTTSGEIELGTGITLYMPNCVTIEKPTGDVNGIITDAINFRATGGSGGSSTEIYMGFV